MLRRVYGIHRLVTVTTVLLALFVVWQSVSGDETLPRPQRPATLFGVGDIMHCASPENAELTGQLMTRLLNDTPDSIAVTFGDNSNDDGAEREYDCFNRSAWGALNSRLYPTPGNHDYGTDKVLPFYFLYFVNAGAPGVGYYAYDFGSWRIYAINSELIAPSARQQQLDWLEEELRVHSRNKCTFAYFHRPPFSSGNFASPAWAMPIFRKLYKYGVDLVATGHEHFFAALPPLDPDGVVDRATGIPMLIAGTGGAVFFGRPPRLRYADAGEVVVARSLGILKVMFRSDAYEWAFVPVNASDPSPSGSGRCHDNPPGYRG